MSAATAPVLKPSGSAAGPRSMRRQHGSSPLSATRAKSRFCSPEALKNSSSRPSLSKSAATTVRTRPVSRSAGGAASTNPPPGARRRRRFDPSSLPTTNANRPPSSTRAAPPCRAGRVRECRAAVGPVVVAAVVPKTAGSARAQRPRTNRPRPNSAGPRAATDTPVDLQPDRVGHVRDPPSSPTS